MQLQVTLLFSDAELERLKKRANKALNRKDVFDSALELMTKLAGGEVFKREDHLHVNIPGKGKRKGKRKPPTESTPDANHQPQAGRARR